MHFAQEFQRFLENPIGFGMEGSHLNSGQAALRAALVYGVSLVLVRLGNRRSLGKASAMDVLLSITLGSTLSRAITGSSPLLPGLAAAGMLIFAHWILAALTFRFHGLSVLVKGGESELVKNGDLQRDVMRREHMSENDVHEALRQQGKTESAEGVASARLERSGEVSVIKRKPPPGPRVVEVRVEAGVQTVRIELGGGGS